MDKSDAVSGVVSNDGAPKPSPVSGVKSSRTRGAPRITDKGSSIVGVAQAISSPSVPARVRPPLSRATASIKTNDEFAQGSSISKVAQAQLPKDEQEKKTKEEQATRKVSLLRRELTTVVDDTNLSQLKEKFKKGRPDQ